MTQPIIAIFKALADEHRLELFSILLSSDRTNSELVEETGLSQNLLSHHLSVLSEAGLIRVQQSIGDARRRYYSVNLETVCLMSDWWRRSTPVCEVPLPPLRRPRRILFLCMRNAARSLMAEAIARHIAAGAIIPSSAGLEASAEITPLMITVLDEKGVPSTGLNPQTYDRLVHEPFDGLITVCDRVHEHGLPPELAHIPCVHWSLHDPLEEADTEAGQLAAMRRLYTEIERRLVLFVQRLAAEES